VFCELITVFACVWDSVLIMIEDGVRLPTYSMEAWRRMLEDLPITQLVGEPSSELSATNGGGGLPLKVLFFQRNDLE